MCGSFRENCFAFFFFFWLCSSDLLVVIITFSLKIKAGPQEVRFVFFLFFSVSSVTVKNVNLRK